MSLVLVSPLKVPTFCVDLPHRDDIAHSVTKIRNGNDYDADDVCTISNWVGLCALNYMIDNFEKKSRQAATPSTLHNYELYFMQCTEDCTITDIMLKKIGVTFSWCNVRGPCQNLQSHHSVLGYFKPEGRRCDIFYDASLHQFFDADRKGYLRPTGYWQHKTSCDVADNLMATERGRDLTTELLTTGSANVDVKDLGAYVKAFTDSMNNNHDDFKRERFSPQRLKKRFVLNENYNVDSQFYAAWAIWPDEPDSTKRVEKFIARAENLRI